MHKGFKCLDISTGHIYISRNVIFDEFIFPFVSLHSTAGAHYHSDILLSPLKFGNNDFTNLANVFTLPITPASDSGVQMSSGSGANAASGAQIPSVLSPAAQLPSSPQQLVHGPISPCDVPASSRRANTVPLPSTKPSAPVYRLLR
jgi:hypothetical protein